VTKRAVPVAILPASYRTAGAQIRRALSLLDYHPRRSKILLKPNVVTVPRWLPMGGVPRAAITDARLIEALLRVFSDYEVTIAESSLASCDTGQVLERTGVAALARRYGARLVNLDEAERFDVAWAFGTLRLPALLRTHEYINVPKLKTHLLTGVTLACKNQKGLLTDADKIRAHCELGLPGAIRALAEAIQPALSIVDGVVGLEGAGPTLGRPRRAGFIVAGQDMHAVDVACCDLISVSLERVDHLDRVAYRPVGRTVEEMRLRFAAPTTARIANLHIHAAPSTCSRCLQSMHDGAAAFWRSPRHMLRGTWSCILRRTDLLMGDVTEVPPAARGRVICYGDCTRRLAEAYGLPLISGCPPSQDAHVALY
jgi:uncharacterized protein (DUF362 family)